MSKNRSFKKRVEAAKAKIAFEAARHKDHAEAAKRSSDHEAAELHEARAEAFRTTLDILKEEEIGDVTRAFGNS